MDAGHSGALWWSASAAHPESALPSSLATVAETGQPRSHVPGSSQQARGYRERQGQGQGLQGEPSGGGPRHRVPAFSPLLPAA